MSEQKPKGAEVLVDEVQIAGYSVRPWSFGKIIQLTQYIDRIKTLLNGTEFKLSSSDSITPDEVEMIVKTVAPLAPVIMSITVDATEEDMINLPGDDGIFMLITIVKQNLGYLKNLYGPVMKILKDLLSEM
jgi:hypothetical protein